MALEVRFRGYNLSRTTKIFAKSRKFLPAKLSTFKVNSGAVHIDIVLDYSAEAVLLTLRRFGALRGWPGVMQSDPGSQLVSASGKLVKWWNDLGGPLREFAGAKNFQWNVSPPDAPWRQGKVERRIGIVKRSSLSVGDTVVSPVELQTIFCGKHM